MKIKRSISKILLSMILCVCLLPMPFGVMAEGEVTVTVSGGTQITFDAATTAYNVTVPVWYASGVDSYTYENPVITVDNAGEAVAVTMPATLPGDATFVIDGTTYTISLGLAKNMYENGGHETTPVKFKAGTQWSPRTRTNDTAYTGSYSIIRLNSQVDSYLGYGWDGQYHQPTLTQGKTYLSSYATRLAPTESTEYISCSSTCCRKSD